MNTRFVVIVVHRVLDVNRDPVGVGAWWVQQNGRLGARPIDLLGTDRELDVVLAAIGVRSPGG